VRVLKYLHERCASSQVRGHITQDLLSRYGIDNTRAIGCPSLLYARKPALKIRPPSLDNVSFTITDMGRLPDIHDWQFSLMETLLQQSDKFSVAAQGGEFVLQDFISARDGVSTLEREDFVAEAKDDAVEISPKTDFSGAMAPGDFMLSKTTRLDLDALEKSARWYYRDCSPALQDNIIDRAFYSPLLSEYVRRSRDLSLCVGTRLHGNLIAMSQGCPAIFAIHDYRLKEMAEFLGAPSVSFETRDATIDLEDADWSEFERRSQNYWPDFRAFFEENGLKIHDLKEEV
ncbi:MAG: polysaccharide pyruvyl transferase family protein, partial [Pseudomonadota bacterium]